MATIEDLHKIKQAMVELKEHPNQCRYVGEIQFNYVEGWNVFSATFDCDLTVYFNRVIICGSEIMLFFGCRRTANLCHKGLV